MLESLFPENRNMKWLTLILIGPALFAQDASLFERLEYRSIGPAVMGGRMTDVERIPGNPWLVYAATARLVDRFPGADAGPGGTSRLKYHPRFDSYCARKKA